MSRALLLFTAGLMMGATIVLSSPGALAPVEGVAFVLAGAGGVSSSSDESETFSRLIVSSSTGVGGTGAGLALVRERGGMFRMCIEDVPSLPIYNLSY
jgi:hypothetical protein